MANGRAAVRFGKRGVGEGGIGVVRAWSGRPPTGPDQAGVVLPAGLPGDCPAGCVPVGERECPDRFPQPAAQAGAASLAPPRHAGQRAAVPPHPGGQERGRGGRREDVRRMAVAVPETVPGPGRIPCLGVWNVPFPMAHLRRPHRMTDITVSRPGGRSVTHGNIFPPPFLSVSPHPGMLAFRWRFASLGGSPWSHPDRWTVPAFLSRLSHVCPGSPAPDQPAAVRGRRASPRA